MKNLVESFNVDHRTLDAGIYLRKEFKFGFLNLSKVRVWDVRFVAPRLCQYITSRSAHVLEHMFAHHLRTTSIGKKVISVNMMGCGTGMYVETTGSVTREQLCKALHSVCELFPINSVMDVPGMDEEHCGNPKFRSISGANTWAEVLKGLTE